MELVSTMEINGEEREIADAYAREQCAANAQKLTEHDSKIYSYKVFTESGMSYDAESDEIVSSSMYTDEVDIAQRVNWHDDALGGVSDTMKAVKKKTDADIDGINNNLSQLSYSDDSGSRNLFNGVILEASNANFQNGVLTNTFADSKTAFAFQIQVYSGSTLVLESPQRIATVNTRNSISLTIPSTSNVTLLRLKHNGNKKDIYITIPFTKTGNFTISVYVSKNNPSAVGGLEIRDIQIEEGTTATDYEPYIPSVKMLAEEVSAQNDSLDVLKNDLSDKLKVISVSLEGVTVSGNSSTTVSLPQEYIDAGYVIANILAVPDTRLSYITSSATSFYIRNSSNSAVMFTPTATVTLLIAKIG